MAIVQLIGQDEHDLQHQLELLDQLDEDLLLWKREQTVNFYSVRPPEMTNPVQLATSMDSSIFLFEKSLISLQSSL